MFEPVIHPRRDSPIEDTLQAEVRSRRDAGEDILDVTQGILRDDTGRPVIHETVLELWRELTPLEIALEAPPAGDPAFLEGLTRWYWPSVEGQACGCATAGGRGALALTLRCFLKPGMSVLTMEPGWSPAIDLAVASGMHRVEAPSHIPGHPLDPEVWERLGTSILERQGRLLLWLNDPCHHPTGRSLSCDERRTLMDRLRSWSERGPVTLILDMAYVDYTTDPVHVREALDDYQGLGREGRVLVGAALSLSKSLTLYGARGGALVFPWTRNTSLQKALVQNVQGLGATAPCPPQALFRRLLREGKYQEALLAEQRHWSEILEARALALSTALRDRGFEGVTWQGGFFVHLAFREPEALAQKLRSFGIFTTPTPRGLGVGLCALPVETAPRLVQALAAAL